MGMLSRASRCAATNDGAARLGSVSGNGRNLSEGGGRNARQQTTASDVGVSFHRDLLSGLNCPPGRRLEGGGRAGGSGLHASPRRFGFTASRFYGLVFICFPLDDVFEYDFMGFLDHLQGDRRA
jgi:hypothetical protein